MVIKFSINQVISRECDIEKKLMFENTVATTSKLVSFKFSLLNIATNELSWIGMLSIKKCSQRLKAFGTKVEGNVNSIHPSYFELHWYIFGIFYLFTNKVQNGKKYTRWDTFNVNWPKAFWNTRIRRIMFSMLYDLVHQ